LSVLALVTVLLLYQPAFAQRLFGDSLGVLPGTITRVEYANLKALRKMPHFPSLRRAYTGGFLSDWEGWLGAFHLSEESIAEVLLGLEGTHTFAIAGGEFNPTLPTQAGSPQSRFVPTNIGDLTGYCLAPLSEGRDCAVFNGQNWAALGKREFLSYVVEGGDGLTEPLSSEPEIMDLLAMVPSDAPLWGVSRGAAAAAWFKAVIPFADSVPIVWSVALDGLDGLTYSVMPDEDQVRVTVNLEFKTSGGATCLGTVLAGVKAIEAVLWQMKHPGDSNPFSGAQVDVDDRTVSLALSVSYGALESGAVLGPTHGR
jgi:hypothetical protein